MSITYAMIAERADVAIPTVYNYFATLTDLFGACIADTTSRAPAVGPKTLAGTSDPGHRLAALVPALFARYRFLSPWLRCSQHEAHLIPELGAFHARFREQHLQLIHDAIAPRGGGRALSPRHRHRPAGRAGCVQLQPVPYRRRRAAAVPHRAAQALSVGATGRRRDHAA